MKKVKMLFLSAAIIAMCSSYAFKLDSGDTYVRVGGSFLLKSGQSGECITETASACNYVLKDGHEPIAESDFDFNTADNEMWDPAP